MEEATERFQEITEAHSTLSDATERAWYVSFDCVCLQVHLYICSLCAQVRQSIVTLPIIMPTHPSLSLLCISGTIITAIQSCEEVQVRV